MTRRLAILLSIFLVLAVSAFAIANARGGGPFVASSPDQSFGPASEYNVRVEGPKEMTLERGKHAFRFTVANTGSYLDDYVISASTTLGVIDVSAVPPVLRVPPHEVRGFMIGVFVPEDAPDGATGSIRVGAISISTPLAFDTAYSNVQITPKASSTQATGTGAR